MDAKIKELLTRLSFFAEEGMGEPKLVEFAKQADALLNELSKQQNTQQSLSVPNKMFVSEFAPRTAKRYAAGWNDCRAAMTAGTN